VKQWEPHDLTIDIVVFVCMNGVMGGCRVRNAENVDCNVDQLYQVSDRVKEVRWATFSERCLCNVSSSRMG
jgi:hypothetical protein